MFQPVESEFERMVIDLEDFVSETNLVIGEDGINSAIAFVSESGCGLRFPIQEVMPPVSLAEQQADKMIRRMTEMIVHQLEDSPVTGASIAGVIFALFGSEVDNGGRVVMVEGHDRYGGSKRVLIRLGQSRRKTYTIRETVNDDANCQWKDFWH